jgi:hypothetical protein
MHASLCATHPKIQQVIRYYFLNPYMTIHASRLIEKSVTGQKPNCTMNINKNHTTGSRFCSTVINTFKYTTSKIMSEEQPPIDVTTSQKTVFFIVTAMRT